MRISDWSSDVCSSDLQFGERPLADALVTLEVSDQPPLQRGDPAALRPRVERPPEQARGVVQEISDRLTHILGYNSSCYYIQQGCGIANNLEYGVNFLYTACMGHFFGQDRKSTRLNSSH